MDLREATKILDNYSTLIVSKIRLRDKMYNLEAAEAKDVMEELNASLRIETRQALIILTLVSEDIAKHAQHYVIGFADELPELIEAVNRNQAATAEALKATLAHQEKSQRREPAESPSAKGIREFLARHRLRTD